MIAFTIWPLNIYRYGIMYVISILIQIWRFRWIAQSQILAKDYPRVHHLIQHGIDTLVMVIVMGIIIWGRLGHVLIYEWSYYSQHPLQIFNLQAWGMSFVGWFVWVMIAVICYMRYHKIGFGDALTIRDLICTFLPFNIALGRFGNRLNQELYGRVVDISSWSDSFISWLQHIHIITTYSSIDSQLRRNTNLLEWCFEGIVLGILTIVTRILTYHTNSIKTGYITATFMIGYSIIRFLLEPLRDNPATEFVGIWNKSQLWMIIMGIVGIWLIFYLRSHYKKWS